TLCACDAAAPGAPTPPASFAAPQPSKAVNSNVSNVLVTNGAAQPIPVAAIGTASVSIDNTPSVTIANTPAVNANITNASLAVTGTVGIAGTVTTVPTGSLASYPQNFEAAD